MTASTSATDHPSRRLIVTLPQPYHEARARYEDLVPVMDESIFAAAASWEETLAIANAYAPHGFIFYARLDVTGMLAGSSAVCKATEYLMGNHTIAETMFRHDPAVMLHAPLRTLIYEDHNGITRFAVDQPSLQFASFNNSEIAAVGQRLDELLAQIITLLTGAAPEALKATARVAQGSINNHERNKQHD